MGNVNLRTFVIDKSNVNLIQLFDMDSDYNGDNGSEYWEMSEEKDASGKLIPLATLEGYSTEAERLINKLDRADAPLEQRIATILNYIDKFCHGSFSSDFEWDTNELGEYCVVSVAYIVN